MGVSLRYMGATLLESLLMLLVMPYNFLIAAPVVNWRVEDEQNVDGGGDHEEDVEEDVVNFLGKQFPLFVDLVCVAAFVHVLENLSKERLFVGTQSWSVFKME